MLKGINKLTGEFVISIHPQWHTNVDQLRDLCRRDVILCPGCKQTLSLRAGNIRKWHFAHRNLSNCPLSRESAKVLEAKVILYKLLQSKFGDRVTLEEQIPGGQPSECADCVVSFEKYKIAYFIVEKQIRNRLDFINLRKKSYSHVHWMLLPRMITSAKDSKKNVLLSATARDLASLDGAEHLYRKSAKCGSLSFIDTKHTIFAIARGLKCVHAPNEFNMATKFKLDSNQIHINPESGQLMDPGEVSRLKEWHEQQELLKQQQRESEARAHRLRLERDAEQEKIRETTRQAFREKSYRKHGRAPQTQPPESDAKERTLTCLRCGSNVTKWVYEQYDGCLCWKCYNLKEITIPKQSAPKSQIKSKTCSEDTDDPPNKKEFSCLHCGKKTRNWLKFSYTDDYPSGVCLCIDCDAKGFELPD